MLGETNNVLQCRWSSMLEYLLLKVKINYSYTIFRQKSNWHHQVKNSYLTIWNHLPKRDYVTYHVSVLTYGTFYPVYCGRLLSQLLFCQFHLCNHLYSWGLDISHNRQHYSGVGNWFYLSQEIYSLVFTLICNHCFYIIR